VSSAEQAGDLMSATRWRRSRRESLLEPDPHVHDRARNDRDESARSRDQAAELRDRGAEDRDALARREERRADDCGRIAVDRDQAWSDDDRAASEHDQESADQDQHAADSEFSAGGDATAYQRGVRVRERSRQEREHVSELRNETTEARLGDESQTGSSEAEHDRLQAASDREGAADDRQESARERAEALDDRTKSALAAQQALNTLESMSDAFFTLDSEWRFTYLNPQTEVILGRPREDLVGQSLWESFPEAVGSRFDGEYRRAMREQVHVRFEEETHEPLARTLEVWAYPVPEGLAVHYRDVTDERLHDERLRQAQRLEAIGRVTAGVAHDFNNLLTAVCGFATLGQAASRDEKVTRYFDEIDSAGKKAVELTRQLLAFAREQDLAPVVVDLNEVVAGLSTLLRQLMPADVELHFATPSHPVPVYVDRSQLEQVLLNLVVNSRDAIGTTGSITVSTAADAPSGVDHHFERPAGWLQVADTGSGIPADVMPHIFDPFFSTKPVETGTGLGLATIYGIVSQSGGAIYVDSAVGTGTTMTIAVPAPDE